MKENAIEIVIKENNIILYYKYYTLSKNLDLFLDKYISKKPFSNRHSIIYYISNNLPTAVEDLISCILIRWDVVNIKDYIEVQIPITDLELNEDNCSEEQKICYYKTLCDYLKKQLQLVYKTNYNSRRHYNLKKKSFCEYHS